MNQSANTMLPSTGTNRVALLDIFRGFALFGIFVVNIRYMSSSVNHPEAFEWMKDGSLNLAIDWLLANFFNSKFFPIFSFLFGVGFAMQINKMEEKKKFNTFFFIRRYFFLMLFGLLHVVFLWGGDVLILYALAGLLVLIIRKVPVKWVFILAVGILLCPFYGYIYGALQNSSSILLKGNSYDYQDILNILLNGSFREKLQFRLYEYSSYFRNVEYFPTLVSLIFFGYCSGRLKFYSNINQTFKRLTPVVYFLLPTVIVFRIAYHQLETFTEGSYRLHILLVKANIIFNIFQSFIYLYLITLFYEKGILIKIIEPLALAGRMSLTNYLMQSVIGVLLFNSVFLGLYGQLGLAWLELFVIISFLLLLYASNLWLSKFRYGPLEYIWREVTYKSDLKFLKNTTKNQNFNNHKL